MRATFLALVTVAGTLAGCATDYVARTDDVRALYQVYMHDAALDSLALAQEKGREQDRLLYMLDRGMILHAAGRYEESIKVLQDAERLAEALDIVSVSEEGRTLLSNERERAYRGEDFERLLINVVNALNYAALDERESALVEIRRAHERLRGLVDDEQKPYKQLAIARYLGGVLYEAEGELDSAYIDYDKARQVNGHLGHLLAPMLRLARETGRDDAAERLAELYPEADAEPLAEDEGWLVVVIEAGLSPEKRPSTSGRGRHGEGDLMVVPVYRSRAGGRPAEVQVGETVLPAVTVTSVDEVARRHLEERVGAMIARSLASGVAKAGVAALAGAATKSEDVGVLTFYLLMLTSAPDLRSWLSLPAEFQVARVRVTAGEHSVSVRWRGAATSHAAWVEAGGTTVLVVRRY